MASAELKSIGTSELDMHLPGGTAGLTIDGKSSELVAKESGGMIVVTAKLDCVMEQQGHLSCIKTGNGTREKQLWKYLAVGHTFIKSHLGAIAGADFFSVEVLRGFGVVRHYVFFVVDIATRRVHIAGTTSQPSESSPIA